jgi:hypothetical protein
MALKVCKTCGCTYTAPPSQKLYYCSAKCYVRTGNLNPKWRGGSVIVDGYVYVYSPSHPNATKLGYVCEHRLVMEAHLGRLLSKQECVHHKDSNKLNNSISNLELCPSNGRHTILHHTPARNPFGKFGPLSSVISTNKKLTLTQELEIYALYKNAHDVRSLAEMFKVSISLIYVTLKRVGHHV